jgi:hypothetical protein
MFSQSTQAKEECTEEVGYFKETKLAYGKNHKLNAPKVRCLALAGDDRAATLYAEYLLEKYNNNGYKEDIYASYAWYRIAVERSSSPGSWKQMPKVLEGAIAGIKESSNELYQQLQKQLAPKQRFNKPSTIEFPKESAQDRKRRIRKEKDSGAPRVPSHRQ